MHSSRCSWVFANKLDSAFGFRIFPASAPRLVVEYPRPCSNITSVIQLLILLGDRVLGARHRSLRMPTSGHNRETKRLRGVTVTLQNKTPQTHMSHGTLSRTALPRSLLKSQSTVRAPDGEGHVRNNSLVTCETCSLQCVGRLSRRLLPSPQLRPPCPSEPPRSSSGADADIADQCSVQYLKRPSNSDSHVLTSSG
jgi:hypothetical protein